MDVVGTSTRPSDRSGPGSNIDVTLTQRDGGLSWTVTNTTGAPIQLDSVQVRLDLGATGGAVRVFCNGYQSWSPTGSVTLGEAADPSLAGTLPFVRAMHHADPAVASQGEIRSEQVTVLRNGTDPALMIGAVAGSRHATTIRLTLDDGRVVAVVEAWLGGATIEPYGVRALHDVVSRSGEEPSALLGDWARMSGDTESARVDAAFQVGWCSWYQLFEHVDERAVLENLARAADWPFEVFQVDDGFQAAIGDWLDTDDSFPHGLGPLASNIAARDLTPGLWIAPFLAAPDSTLARRHPGWMARDDSGEPLVGMYNPHWGGFVWQLDVTRPEVLAHLESTARALRQMGFRYLKLDFTFSAALPGRYADTSLTPAQRVRAGYEAVRRGAGDDVFILACGCPLGAVVGVVDGMRIGPDVAPSWEIPAMVDRFAGYERAAPSTRNAAASTLSRAPLHRRLWLNDPDCVMLRHDHTELAPHQIDTWAAVVGRSGGMVLASDDLTLLGASERQLLNRVIATAKEVDAESIARRAPTCADLLDANEPTCLASHGRTLRTEPSTGRSTTQ